MRFDIKACYKEPYHKTNQQSYLVEHLWNMTISLHSFAVDDDV